MKAVLKYPGAKNRIANKIIKFIPKHTLYCEPYFGSGAIFFNKLPCYNEIINDIDDQVYNFFKVLREREDELIKAIKMTPYSRTEYINSYKSDGNIDEVEKARRFAIKCWQGFGCGNKYKNGFRRGIGQTSPNPAKAWAELEVTLKSATKRLKNAQIENIDAIELINLIKSNSEAFIYIDPPYLQSTRKKYLYNHELSDSDHIKLLESIKCCNCKIMISGYESDMYEKYLKGFTKIKIKTTAECSVPRTEVLWMNYKQFEQIEF